MSIVQRIGNVKIATALVLLAAAILFACSQTPTSVPVRTFERAQRMDTVCLQLYDRDGNAIQPVGRPASDCAPVPADVDGRFYRHQLFALVTQSLHGELAVVDLSAGSLIDTQYAVPGINFLPVGALPTDVAATPDGVMVFVASAEPNKPAIYGVPTRRVLGDTPGFPRDPERNSLGSWPVCTLPQNPGAVLVVPRPKTSAPAPAPQDAGAGDGGDAGDAGDAGAPSDAGVPPADDRAEYELAVVLPGDRVNPAQLVTIDPRPFRRGALPRLPDGKPDYSKAKGTPAAPGFDESLTAGDDVLAPGEPRPCKVTSAKRLVGGEVVPKSIALGPAWDDGVKYVDGGIDLRCKRPVKSAGCGLEPCCTGSDERKFPATTLGDAGGDASVAPVPQAYDAGTPIPGQTCEETAPDAGPAPLDYGTLDPPRLVSMARDETMLYIADEGLPLIHVVDVSDLHAPRELQPLLATSAKDPTRVVKIKEIAISPPTRDFKRFLYAIDRVEGSIAVFDVTDPVNGPRVPMTRPHPELNPFQPIDRIAYSNPVVSVSFARNEVPLGQIGGVKTPSAATGLLCNPNPNLVANPVAQDLGFYYRASSVDPGLAIGPRRLRGIFGFATLATGRVMIIDVDDWDAPCRRPDHLGSASTDGVALPPESDIARPQPVPGPGDLDPYHAPDAPQFAVTDEAFFPMSAPHSPRSDVLIKDDPTTGSTVPGFLFTPTVRNPVGALLPTDGPDSVSTPLLESRFAFEVPDVHIRQDWAVRYEGQLPGFLGISTVVSTEKPQDYSTIVLSQTQASFCARGIEDFAAGTDRALKVVAELKASGSKPPTDPPLEKRFSDYVRFTEELLDPADDYWKINLPDNDPAQCWENPADLAANKPRRFPSPQSRYDVCRATFGLAGEGNAARDFPILEAYADRLVLGRFFTPSATRPREVVGRDPSNAEVLRLARCCFHHQVRFDVRASNQWVAVGHDPGAESGVGFLHHMTTGTGGRCVPSCDLQDQLLNGRVPAVSVVPSLGGVGRDSARAMRNPMFAIAIANPASGKEIARDTVYGFTNRGEFRYLLVNIAGTTTSVSPQSMRFIDPIGQIGVVDGASQGLTLIDLRAVTVARAPYF